MDRWRWWWLVDFGEDVGDIVREWWLVDCEEDVGGIVREWYGGMEKQAN